MLAAFRNLPGFRGEAQLSTWLYQIARSFCIKLRRPGNSVRADAALDSAKAQRVPAAGPPPDEGTHAREIGAALSAAIRMLPEASREALILRDVEGLGAEEAAEVAGIEVAALKSRLHRARLEVRSNLTALLLRIGRPRSKRVRPAGGASVGLPALQRRLRSAQAHGLPLPPPPGW